MGKANTVLRNLVKRPRLKSLNRDKVINQKLSVLDEKNGRPNDEPFRMEYWEKSSDIRVEPEYRSNGPE